MNLTCASPRGTRVSRSGVRPWEHEKGFVPENALFQKVSASNDAKEGPRAYAEKRKPVFRGY